MGSCDTEEHGICAGGTAQGLATCFKNERAFSDEFTIQPQKQGADANSIAPDGWVRDEHSGFGGKSILHHAAWVGSLPIFKILVEEGGADFLKRCSSCIDVF